MTTATTTNLGYCNHLGHTDIRPYEVVARLSETRIQIREMDSDLAADWKPEVAIGGFVGNTRNNDSQKWIITSNASNPVITVRMSRAKSSLKDGFYFDASGARYQLSDKPVRFYDYNF